MAFGRCRTLKKMMGNIRIDFNAIFTKAMKNLLCHVLLTLWNWVQYLLFKHGHWCPRHACIQLGTCFAEYAFVVYDFSSRNVNQLCAIRFDWWLCQHRSEWTFRDVQHFSCDDYSQHNDDITQLSQVQPGLSLFSRECIRSRVNRLKYENWPIETQQYHQLRCNLM